MARTSPAGAPNVRKSGATSAHSPEKAGYCAASRRPASMARVPIREYGHGPAANGEKSRPEGGTSSGTYWWNRTLRQALGHHRAEVTGPVVISTCSRGREPLAKGSRVTASPTLAPCIPHSGPTGRGPAGFALSFTPPDPILLAAPETDGEELF